MADAVSNPATPVGTTASGSVSTTGTTAALANDATRGWAELQRATNVVLPQLLNEAERISRATLRLLGG